MTHPSAEALFKMVRRRLPSISFGTVYRNLNVLRDDGEILELACGRRSCRYDGNPARHYHFVCRSCEGIYDIDADMVRGVDGKALERAGYEVSGWRVDFYGTCKRCK